MEYSNASAAWSYSVLIPKKYLYRHVHGYWAEQAFEILAGRALPVEDAKATLDTMYIRTEYDWRLNTPDRITYRNECLARTKTMRKYFEKNASYLPEVYSPFFNETFSTHGTLLQKVKNFLLLNFVDLPKNIARTVLGYVRS